VHRERRRQRLHEEVKAPNRDVLLSVNLEGSALNSKGGSSPKGHVTNAHMEAMVDLTNDARGGA
jgi:hypothetical protein